MEMVRERPVGPMALLPGVPPPAFRRGEHGLA